MTALAHRRSDGRRRWLPEVWPAGPWRLLIICPYSFEGRRRAVRPALPRLLGALARAVERSVDARTLLVWQLGILVQFVQRWREGYLTGTVGCTAVRGCTGTIPAR